MPAKNTSVTLTEHQLAYARAKVDSGTFASVSDVIRDALRRAEERDRKVAALDKALQEGLDSGPALPFDLDRFHAEMGTVTFQGASLR